MYIKNKGKMEYVDIFQAFFFLWYVSSIQFNNQKFQFHFHWFFFNTTIYKAEHS